MKLKIYSKSLIMHVASFAIGFSFLVGSVSPGAEFSEAFEKQSEISLKKNLVTLGYLEDSVRLAVFFSDIGLLGKEPLELNENVAKKVEAAARRFLEQNGIDFGNRSISVTTKKDEETGRFYYAADIGRLGGPGASGSREVPVSSSFEVFPVKFFRGDKARLLEEAFRHHAQIMEKKRLEARNNVEGVSP